MKYSGVRVRSLCVPCLGSHRPSKYLHCWAIVSVHGPNQQRKTRSFNESASDFKDTNLAWHPECGEGAVEEHKITDAQQQGRE